MLSFAPKLSLEEIVLRRVVVNAWNGTDVLNSIEKLLIENPNEYREFRLEKQNERWHETVENEVKFKISELPIPESLKKRMMHIVRPIGLQISDWNRLVETYLSDSRKYLDVNFLKQLCWTSAGAIDYKKTAENIVRLETFDVAARYRWACMFCLADSIPVLWKKLPLEHKKSVSDETDASRTIDMKIESFWQRVLKREQLKPVGIQMRVARSEARLIPYDNLSFHQKAFLRSALHGNKTASEYFFQKLASEECGDFLIGTACDVAFKRLETSVNSEALKFQQRNLSDVLCYLLSVMNAEQQMQVFQKHPHVVFQCFLDWPWQDFFLDFTDLLWTFFTETQCTCLAFSIQQYLRNESYPTPNLMRKFYLRSPSNFKKAFEWDFLSWYSQFSDDEDYGFMEAILRDMDPEDKASLGDSSLFRDVIEVFMKRDRWRLVELWIREATPSGERRERVKEIIDTDVLHNFDGEERMRKTSRLNGIFELLEETVASALD